MTTAASVWMPTAVKKLQAHEPRWRQHAKVCFASLSNSRLEDNWRTWRSPNDHNLASSKCPEVTCRTSCPYEFERDVNGCLTCRCKNPCAMVRNYSNFLCKPKSVLWFIKTLGLSRLLHLSKEHLSFDQYGSQTSGIRTATATIIVTFRDGSILNFGHFYDL